MKLYEMPNTAVLIETLDEFDHYMTLCRDVNWKTLFPEYWQMGTQICIEINSDTYWAGKQFYEDNGFTILTFSELLDRLGYIQTELSFKDIHPYIIYSMFSNNLTPILCDGELTGIFESDKFLVRFIGDTHDCEMQLGLKNTFTNWNESIDITSRIRINNNMPTEFIINFITEQINKAENLINVIPEDYFKQIGFKITI